MTKKHDLTQISLLQTQFINRKTHRPSSLFITFSVWKALFLREAIARLSTGRIAWVWLLLEPMVHVSVLLFVFTVIRMRVVGGIDTAIWLMVGMLAFFMFKRTAMQTTNAVNANRALFTYRQVKPVDTVLARAVLEGFLMVIIITTIFASASLFNLNVNPVDPLAVLAGFFGLWLIGTGFGLISSVINDLVPELGKIVSLIMTPLYLLSGVIVPVASIPQPYRDGLMFNPLVHGIESIRAGFASYYHVIPKLNIYYLYGWAVLMIFFGLALHRRYAIKLVTK